MCVEGGWVLLGALGVATVIYIRLYELPEQWWLFLWIACTGMAEFSFLLLAVIVGFSLKRQTWVAELFIACCEPFCIEMFRDPSELVIENLLESPSVLLESTLYALLLFPVFSFLMIMPIGVLWPGPEWRKKRWLLLLSTLTFILMEIARWTALRGTPDAYSFYAWLMAGSSAAQLWLPLALRPVWVRRSTQRGFESSLVDCWLAKSLRSCIITIDSTKFGFIRGYIYGYKDHADQRFAP